MTGTAANMETMEHPSVAEAVALIDAALASSPNRTMYPKVEVVDILLDVRQVLLDTPADEEPES